MSVARKSSKFNEVEAARKTKELLNAGVPMIVFDFETTGLSVAADRVISFSAIKIVKENGIAKEVDRRNIFINPGMHIPEAASQVNRITDEVVANCPREEEVIGDIREFLGEKPFICGYHSHKFDEPFLNEMYKRHFGEEFKPLFHTDVWRMAKEKLDLSSYKLEIVSPYLGTDVGVTYHESMGDVLATYRTLEVLLDMYDEEDELPCFKMRIKAKDARLFRKSTRVNRIYVSTFPYSKTFYDIYQGSWKSDMDIDLDALRADILKQYNVADEKELAKVVPKSG